MKKIRRIIATLFVALILIAKPINADVGDFDRYDSGSDSDWGSSDWDFSDWGSSDWGSSWSSDSGSYDSDYDYSEDGEDFYRGVYFLLWLFGGSSGASILTRFIIFGIIAMIVLVNHYNNVYKGNKKFRKESDPNGPVYTTEVRDVPISHIAAYKIQQVDPLFSEEKFLAWSKDLYVKMQQAWTARDWEPIRPYETEELFEQHSAQLQEFIRGKKINVVEQIAVNYATVYSFRQTDDKDIVEVALKATKKDYVIDEESKAVLQGNKDQDRITVYKMTFERTKGKQTQAGTEEVDAKNCPNCGAPLKFTSSGKCVYCGSIVSTGVHDWVLSNLEPLKY